MSADGDGVVSHAGAGLLAEVADRVGLAGALSTALGGMRERRGKHDLGRVIRDLAVTLADGGDCLADLRVVRDQQPLFGAVASDATAFRVIDRIASDPTLLDGLRAARAAARARAWELGVRPDELVLDIDATLITSHSEKDQAAGNYKHGFGFHPLLAFLDDRVRRSLASCGPGSRLEHRSRSHHRDRSGARSAAAGAGCRSRGADRGARRLGRRDA